MPERIRSIKVDIEVPILLLYFAFSFSGSISSNLIIFRTCYVNLGYNESECSLLGTDHPDNITLDLEKATQPYSSRIETLRKVPTGILTGILCLFLGSWSDRFGRKPVMLAGMIGFGLNCFVQVIFVLAHNLSSWYSLLWNVPLILTGGITCFQTVVLCYISDLSTENDRGLKMSLYQGALQLGSLSGYLTSSWVLYKAGYTVIYIVCTVTVLIALIYVKCFIKESVQNVENISTKEKFKKIFELNNFKSMAVTTFKPRPNYRRFMIIIGVLLSTLTIFINLAEDSVFSLYLRARFSWSLTHINLFIGIRDFIHTFGILFGELIFEKLLKLPETGLILIAATARIFSSTMQGFAKDNTMIYIASTIHCLSGILSPAIRSYISKLVPSSETGKLFSFTVTSETVLGMLGPPLYTEIYRYTLKNNPGLFNFITAALYVVLILLTVAIIVPNLFISQQNYTVFDDEIVNNDENNENSNPSTNPVPPPVLET